MQFSRKWWRFLGLGLALAVVLLLVVRTWVVPALIVSRLESQIQAKVTIRSWWLNGRSAGVVGLAVHEDPSPESAVFASAPRVTTDLSIWGMLRGRFSPRQIDVSRPELTIKLGRGGNVYNLPKPRGGAASPGPLPGVSVRDARLTFSRDGAPADMVVSGVKVDVTPDATRRKATISGGTDDPTWGRWDVSGLVDSESRRGNVTIRGDHFEANPRTLPRVPFVPGDVWTHVSPRGPVNVQVAIGWQGDDDPVRSTLDVRSEVALLGTSANFSTLGFGATGATGRLTVEQGGLVRVEGVAGEALGGRASASGMLDFRRCPYHLDLGMDLKAIKVEDTPKFWGLDEAGITGRLSGKVRLRVVIQQDGAIDLSGSSGEAVVENATLQGIPVKSLRLQMRASGTDVKYETRAAGETRLRRTLGTVVASLAAPLLHDVVALQAAPARGKPATKPAEPPAAPKGEVPKDEPPKPKLRLPKAITTQLELEDVEMAQLIAKAQALSGFPFPIPISGKLTLKAEATIPLGTLTDFRSYAFHGDATLKGASIFKVDIGRLSARLDLADGVLDLKDLRGVLIHRPHGGPDNPPPPTAPEVPAEGPLPPGGFRGHLHAELSPPGGLSARFEGSQLPLSELSAPVLPRPTPLDGLATLRVEARADLRSAADPAAWAASGQAEGVHVTYRGAALDEVSLRFELKQGHLEVPRLAARLGGRPLTASAGLDLKPPRAFRGSVDVQGWDVAQIVALVPSAPHPSPLSGTLTARAEAHGTADPWTIETRGEGHVAAFEAGPVPLGDVPFRWTTARDAVAVNVDDARPFGGRLSAQARVPIAPGRAIEGSARFAGVDTARLSDAIPGGGLKLTGKADGAVAFTVPPRSARVEASVQLSAPDLTVQGVPAEHVRASVRAQRSVLNYEVTADSLGGKVKFLGEFPLASSASARGGAHAAEGELRVVGFTLDELWKALNTSGGASRLTGLGAIDANVRDVLEGRSKGVWARGIFELRDLAWGPHLPLGHLRGIITKTPSVWRVEPLSGELLGGQVGGLLWGTATEPGARQAGFNVRVDRAPIRRILEFARPLQPYVDGHANIGLVGSLDRAFRSEVNVEVEQARVAGLPVGALKVPVELVVAPNTGAGTATVRRAFARVAGGQIRGDASFRLGEDRSFRAQAQLADIDLLTLSRVSSDSTRPSTGRIGGRVSLSGADPERIEGYRGRVDLELSDASLFSIPVFREIDKFLGSARGGLFEEGELAGAIANRQFIVEALTLRGRLVQLHATGTVGFDTQLNLEVLINTNQIIPETGEALVARIPGLSDVLGRSGQAAARVGTYLSNRLLKLRVTGTVRNPTVNIDPAIVVAETAVAFFADVLKLPLTLFR